MIAVKDNKNLLVKQLASEYFMALLSSLAVWVVLFTASGLLFSGFHFIDDHEIVIINNQLHTTSLPDVLRQWVVSDYNISRFRPAYYIHRVLQTKFFGLNWILWFAYACFQSSITTFCLFIFARSIQFSRLESTLLAGLTVFGEQSAIWFRLGPAEKTAIPFLALALVCASVHSNDKRYNLLRDFLLLFSTIFSSLCKESFVLLVPAICLFRVWNTYRSNPNIEFKQLFHQQNIFPCYFLMLVFGLEVLYIKFIIGTGGPGYAGVDSSNFDLNKMALTLWTVVQKGNLLFALIFLSLFCLLSFVRKILDRPKLKENQRSLLTGIAFAFIVFPQVWLYTKSGFIPHYLLPVLIGCSLLNIQTLALYRQNSLKSLKWLLVAILSFIIFQNFQTTWTSLRNFSLEGESTKLLFENIENCTREDSNILVVVNPRIHQEFPYSLKQYLYYVSDRKDLILSTYGLEGTDFKSNSFPEEAKSSLDPDFLRRIYNGLSLDTIHDKSNIKAIIVFPGLREDFLLTSESWFQPDRFHQSEHKLYYFGGSILTYCEK